MTKPKSQDPVISDDEIREIAQASGFTLREQADGEMDLNPYVYDFARTLIGRARGAVITPQREARCVLVVMVDRRTGATLEYDVADTSADAVARWQNNMNLASGLDLLEEIVETPAMWAKVLVNNLDDSHSYLMVRGDELQVMGAAVNALISKRWPSDITNTTLLTRQDMEQLSSPTDKEV